MYIVTNALIFFGIINSLSIVKLLTFLIFIEIKKTKCYYKWFIYTKQNLFLVIHLINKWFYL